MNKSIKSNLNYNIIKILTKFGQIFKIMGNKTFIDILYEQGNRYPSKQLYIFLLDGEKEEQSITYEQLIIKARMLAHKLEDITERNDRVLLFYPPGLEYIIAFYACLFNGLIAVPAYPPDSRNISRIYSIIQDSKAKLALCPKDIYEKVSSGNILTQLQGRGKKLILLSTDIINEPNIEVDISTKVLPEDIAFLQYTSGSTSNPKGVIVSHENLIANCNLFSIHFEYNDVNHVKVSWLPPYHDNGLVDGIIHPIYAGITSVMMSPISFARKPVRWLQAITNYSNYGHVVSGGPNFAYEMCCNYVDDDQLDTLNLSKWRLAYNGAEPVRASTLQKFDQKFSKTGFKYQHFNPCYGLAEATLIVSSGILKDDPVIKKFDAESLKNNLAREVEYNHPKQIELVGSGKNLHSHKIAIINPSTKKQEQEYNIGEIWVKGPSVAQGYWQNNETTQNTFDAYISGTNEGPFLRTGDLGFFDEEKNLFVTGRIKELLIIRGLNYYPQDIEETAEQACEQLRSSRGGAFSIDFKNEEVLVLVYELQRKYRKNANFNEIKFVIKDSFAKKYGLAIHDIVLIETSSFPKTSSGKLQRQLAKEMYLNKELKELG